jgi:hypothetical protein
MSGDRSWSETFSHWLPRNPFRTRRLSTVSAPPDLGHEIELSDGTMQGAYEFCKGSERHAGDEAHITLCDQRFPHQGKSNGLSPQGRPVQRLPHQGLPEQRLPHQGQSEQKLSHQGQLERSQRAGFGFEFPELSEDIILGAGDQNPTEKNDCQSGNFRARHHRKLKEPKSFNSVSIEWSDYLKHFETVADWNGWNDADRAAQLVMCFDGEAIKLLGELSRDVLSDYHSLVAELNRRYDPTERAQAFKLEFRNRFRKSSESVSQYAQSLSRLVSKAFPSMPTVAQQQWVLDQFTLGLGSVELQRHVQFGHPRSLNEAISLAIEFEAFEAGLKHRKAYQKPSEVYAVTAVAEPTLRNQGSKNQSSEQNDKSNSESRTCHFCRKPGHLIKDCRALKQKQEQELRNPGNQFTNNWHNPQPNFDHGHYPQYTPNPVASAPFQAAPYPRNQGNY